MYTNEIAKLAGVHPNTVRLYESWGYISPAPRKSNGYREYSLTHALQMKIARLAFTQEFIQNNLRKVATEIVLNAGKENFSEALILAKHYEKYLYGELEFTNKAVETVNSLITYNDHDSKTIYSHREVAQLLQLTEETLRHWERNGLYSVNRNKQKRRLYTEADIRKLLIIRTLRSAHFSIASIYHLLVDIHKLSSIDDIRTTLNRPMFQEQFFHVTDALEINLNRAITDVQTIIALIEIYNKGELSIASLSTIS